MTRLERRKRSRARKDAKAAKLMSRALVVLNEERSKQFYSDPRLRGKPQRSPKGMGNNRVYSGTLYPMPGYGTGAFKEAPLSERQCRELRSQGR